MNAQETNISCLGYDVMMLQMIRPCERIHQICIFLIADECQHPATLDRRIKQANLGPKSVRQVIVTPVFMML